jgi:hypothetical protein
MILDNGLAAPGPGRFEATRWSEAQSRAQGGPEALARLCERYWLPLYAFARHRGHGPEDAQDLVRGFFEHLIESRALGAIDQAKGRFRSFLLVPFRTLSPWSNVTPEPKSGAADCSRCYSPLRTATAILFWIDCVAHRPKSALRAAAERRADVSGGTSKAIGSCP